MKKSFIYILSLALLLLISSCGESRQTRIARTRAEYEKQVRANRAALKIGALPTMDCLPLFIAQDDSLFKMTGSDIRLKMRNSQLDNDTAFIGGSIEGMVTDIKRLENIEKKGIAVKRIATTNAYWQLYGNPKARIFEVKQLGNKMVAMTRYSATDYLTDVALKGVKTQGTVYRVQFNDVKLRLKMLLNNEMDALWLPEPQATVAREHGNTVLWDTRKAGMKLGRMVVREKDIADKRVREQVEKLVKGYNMACDSLNSKGLSAYGEVIVKYCHVEEKSIGALPKVRFEKLK